MPARWAGARQLMELSFYLAYSGPLPHALSLDKLAGPALQITSAALLCCCTALHGCTGLCGLATLPIASFLYEHRSNPLSSLNGKSGAGRHAVAQLFSVTAQRQ